MRTAPRVFTADPIIARTGVTPTTQRWRNERLFFSGMAVAAAIIIAIGFAPSYFLKGLYGGPPLSTVVHVHGAVFTSWIVLLVLQSALVAARRVRLHRTLGTVSVALVPAMLVVGYLAAVAGAQRGVSSPGDSPEAFMIVTVGGLATFGPLAAAALAFRRRPDVHKRLILVATAELLQAGVGRLPPLASATPAQFLAATDLFVVPLIVYDLWMLGRPHKSTIWAVAYLVSTQAVRVAIAHTPAWTAFAGWMLSQSR